MCAGLLIACATLLRVFLAYNNWPLLNADEGVMGIMALHIQAGQHPIFFYGQNYMGALEAYLGAGLFFVFGPSPFALRLALIVLFLLFLVCLYVLTALLYTKRFALYMLFLFSLGSNVILSRQLSPLGGYAEILVCGTLSFLLTLLLSLSAARPGSRPVWRGVGYVSWGIVVGVGIWSDLLILPAIICSALVLLVFCWQDLKKGALLFILLGLIVGAMPLILATVNAAPGQNPWSALIGMQGAPAWSVHTAVQQISRTVIYSLPAITGNPLCHTDDLSSIKMLGFEPVQPMNAACITIKVSWSCCYLFLLLYAIVLQVIQVRNLFFAWHTHSNDEKISGEFIRACVAFAIVLQAALTLCAFLRSHAPLDGASVYARYLVCIWIATPILLWPLWRCMQKVFVAGGIKSLRSFLVMTLMVIMILCLSYGTYETLTEVPQARTAYAQEEELISSLSQHGITHVYTDYWTCYRLAFQSAERVTCGVVTGDCSFRADQHNRYKPYYDVTSHDPHAAYLLNGNDCANVFEQRGGYQSFAIDGYTVYQLPVR
ncbi:hypothetical protein ccbrp13_30320 [Ktedonobacteria bacterium brp13]|nr:hypothetical protein ccbrp13_30320 [Ktedonobacteria bacterium brp13]